MINITFKNKRGAAYTVKIKHFYKVTSDSKIESCIFQFILTTKLNLWDYRFSHYSECKKYSNT